MKEFTRKCGASFCRGCGKNCAGLPTGNVESTGGYTRHESTTLMGHRMVRASSVIELTEEDSF